jgi:hypothetical protein
MLFSKLSKFSFLIFLTTLTFNSYATETNPLQITEEKVAFDEALIRQGTLNFLGSSRTKYELTVDAKGTFLFKGKPLITNDNEFIWLMDKDKKFYGLFTHRAYPSYYNDSELGLFHSSLLGDEWPIAAGTLTTDTTGYLTMLSNDSGHFAPPTENLEYAIDAFKSSGVMPSTFNSLHTSPPPDVNIMDLSTHSSITPPIVINNDADSQISSSDSEPSLLPMEEDVQLPTRIRSFSDDIPRADLTVSQYKQLLLARENEFNPLDDLSAMIPTKRGTSNAAQEYLMGDFHHGVITPNKYKVGFSEEGQLQNDLLLTSNSAEKKLLWTLEKDGEMYIIPASKDLSHYNLLHGNWPVAAGEMSVKDGHILSINNNSELLQPSEESLTKTLAYLRQRAVPIDPNEIDFITYGSSERLESSLDIQQYRQNFRAGSYFQTKNFCSSSL